jgi:SAM-dependent methyltransferase
MKDKIKGLWRLFQPVKSHFLKGPLQLFKGYRSFYKDYLRYKSMGGSVNFRYFAPFLPFTNHDNQTGGGHYFYQDVWALKILSQLKPVVHFDIGSRFDGFVGQATAICKIFCVDIRKPSFVLPDFNFTKGSITDLPFEDNSVQSLSCLHTIEHIGLGRYGDEIDPHGFEKGLKELQRVIAPNGHLILSMPVGIERVEFNAQRVLNPITPLSILDELTLVEFSVVNDSNQFIKNVIPSDY